MTLKTAIFTTTDDVPEMHRHVGYFYWPNGELANVVFRGSDPVALREKIVAFYDDQKVQADAKVTKIDARTKEGKALLAAQKVAA